MIKESGEFRVFTDGFSAAEDKLISTILKLSAKRPRQYIHSTSVTEKHDIVIVNGDSTASQKHKSANSNTNNNTNSNTNNNKSAVVFVGGNSEAGDFHIDRPVAPTKLLKILDDITVKVLQYVPEVLAANKHQNEKQAIKHSEQQAVRHSDDTITRDYTILVVDDSRPVRQAIRAKMLDLNINTVTADCGEKALELIAKRHFDLIFLDIDLPDINGYQVCKEIRANRDAKLIPVCMLTGKGSPIDKIKGKMAGCNSYLTKPVTVQDLLDIIYKHIPKLPHLSSLA